MKFSYENWTSGFVIVSGLLGIAFGLVLFKRNLQINVRSKGFEVCTLPVEGAPLVRSNKAYEIQQETSKLCHFHAILKFCAYEHVKTEYALCITISLFITLLIFVSVALGYNETMVAVITATAFFFGTCLSTIIGYLGVKCGLNNGIRTAISCQERGQHGFLRSFLTASCGGGSFAFISSGLGLILFYGIIELHKIIIHEKGQPYGDLIASITGLALGVSLAALYLRIGGGIFNNATDIATNLISKVIFDIPEYDSRNPAVIADLVGENVGNISGVACDLFGSWIEGTCAAIYITSQIDAIGKNKDAWNIILFPLLILSIGIITSVTALTILVYYDPAKRPRDIDMQLRTLTLLSSILMIPLMLIVTITNLPNNFLLEGIVEYRKITPFQIASCISIGILSSLLHGLSTEYFTSNKYNPVQELAYSATSGAANEISHGIALGYSSVLPSALIHGIALFLSFNFADFYGVSMAAVGAVSMLPSYMTVALVVPICDNAVGIATLSGLKYDVIQRTISLHNSCNTMSAIGRGYASTCALFTSIAVFGALSLRFRNILITNNLQVSDSILKVDEPLSIAFLLIGAAIPSWLSSITLRSVNHSVNIVIKSVTEQFRDNPDLLDPDSDIKPDYIRCTRVATETSMQETLIPAAVGILTPLFIGIFFGVTALLPMLFGFILSGCHKSIAMSNTGSSWNNAKRIIAVSDSDKRTSELYKATVIGDTIGDPMKDTAGPSLNILMKLMTVSSFVLLPFYMTINDGKGLLDVESY